MDLLSIIPIGKQIIGKILKVAKGLFGLIPSFVAQQGGSSESVNNNSSLEDVNNVVEIFSDFKQKVHIKTVEIEKEINEEIQSYLEELIMLLENNEDIVQKYDIKITSIERRINRILPNLKGVIDYEVLKKVSLDNSECKNIMKMPPGQNKEQSLHKFINQVLENALNVCCTNIRENLAEIFEDINDEIISKVEMVEQESKNQSEKLKEVNVENIEEQSEKIISEAAYLIDVCTVVEDLL